MNKDNENKDTFQAVKVAPSSNVQRVTYCEASDRLRVTFKSGEYEYAGVPQTVADAWATALSVLGPKGLELLDTQGCIEAMIVVGGPRDYTIHQTPGFAKLLIAPIPASPAPESSNLGEELRGCGAS